MKPDDLSDVIGLVDEPLIDEADRGRRVVHRGRRWWVQWVAIAACLCLIAAGVFSLPRLSPKDTKIPLKRPQSIYLPPCHKPEARKAMIVFAICLFFPFRFPPKEI